MSAPALFEPTVSLKPLSSPKTSVVVTKSTEVPSASAHRKDENHESTCFKWPPTKQCVWQIIVPVICWAAWIDCYFVRDNLLVVEDTFKEFLAPNQESKAQAYLGSMLALGTHTPYNLSVGMTD